MVAPFSWPPSQYWDGDDGSWSSFALRVGKPEQTVRVLPSTAGQSTWVVTPQGCPPGEVGTSPSSTCSQSRGGLFEESLSRSWHTLGNYTLDLEVNLGYHAIATYGLDSVTLGFSDANGGPTLDSQVITSLATDYFYTGIFGLGHQGTNLTNLTEPHPTFLSTMKAKNLIPSLSWAYTAGTPHQSEGFFGSLTFGGYDSSRFVPNNVSFSLAPDISRDLVVGLQSIKITNTTHPNNSATSLLPTPILTFIDSTLPYIYLPTAACQAFESTFGLIWNETAEMYLVDDALHRNLLSENPAFTFTIGNSQVGGPTVDIVLPYSSFDLEAKYPSVLNNTHYFPLLRAANDSQYTLGRTFLQDAYLITDYERSNFSVSQCKFEDGLSANIVTISSTTATPNHISRVAVIGISIGAAIFSLLNILAVVFFVRRQQGKIPPQVESNTPEPSTPLKDFNTRTICSIPEIDQNSLCGPYRELPDNGKAELLDENFPSGSGKDISEMGQAPPPVVHELRTTRSSKDHAMVQIGKKGGIFVSTKFSRKSWTSIESSDGTPCIETLISSSPWHSNLILDKSSVHSFDIEKEILASYRRKSLNLQRSLPPTLISESPQVSPVIGTFSHRFATPRPLRTVLLGVNKSMSAFISPKSPMSKYSSLRGMETVIPPERSDTDVSDISASSKEEQETHNNWI